MKTVNIDYVTEDECRGVQLSPDIYVFQGQGTDKVGVGIFRSVVQPDITETGKDRRTRPEVIYQEFLNLLLSTSVKPHDMEYYASELCVSAKYLSAVCRKESGKTAPQIIRAHIMNDVRRYLVGTDLTVKEIAFRLKFSNYAFFCRTVKGYFGKSPLEIRKDNKKQ